MATSGRNVAGAGLPQILLPRVGLHNRRSHALERAGREGTRGQALIDDPGARDKACAPITTGWEGVRAQLPTATNGAHMSGCAYGRAMAESSGFAEATSSRWAPCVSASAEFGPQRGMLATRGRRGRCSAKVVEVVSLPGKNRERLDADWRMDTFWWQVGVRRVVGGEGRI